MFILFHFFGPNSQSNCSIFAICFFHYGQQVRLVFNKSVSWVRVRDDHILTVDQITFIADERFHAYHATENGATQSSTLSNQRRQLGTSGSVTAQKATTTVNDHNSTSANSNSANAPWTLQIKYVQARDAGLYECQISAEPKISARVYLHVVGKCDYIFRIRTLTPFAIHFVGVPRILTFTTKMAHGKMVREFFFRQNVKC